MSDIDDSLIAKVVRQDDTDRKALSILLERLHAKTEHHLAIQVHMGSVDSYVTSVPLRWIASSKVGFAADLPIFKESIQGSKRIVVDQETIDTIQQRQPDWRRQYEMTAYLATRRHPKFPPLLLVAYQHWVYDPNSDEWEDGRAARDSLTLVGLESSGTYYDLDDRDTHFYALDGQHRLMAIMGLRDLIDTGSLHALDENRRQRKQPPLKLDLLVKGLEERVGGEALAIRDRLQGVMDERIGIEIVPAVRRGETFDDALRRLRQLFVDVNEHAKTLTTSQLVQLDENNGFRIVARRLMSHPLLRSATDPKGVRYDRVHTKNQTLSENSPSYTTLHALSTVVEKYLIELGTPEEVALWRPVVKGSYRRPDDAGLDAGTSAMLEYFNALARVPSHEAFIQGKDAGEIRRSEDNALFRPVAQMALAEAIGMLSREGVSLAAIAEVLAEKERNGQLRLTDPVTPWFGVLCDPVPPHKMRRHKRNERLCSRLFRYLLGGGLPDDVDREALRADFANERKLGDDVAVDLSGAEVRLGDVRLPAPWR